MSVLEKDKNEKNIIHEINTQIKKVREISGRQRKKFRLNNLTKFRQRGR